MPRKNTDIPYGTAPSLSDYIAKTYSVSLCVLQSQRLLHVLGFLLVRPQVFTGKGMGSEREREDLKELKEPAQNREAIAAYQDIRHKLALLF